MNGQFWICTLFFLNEDEARRMFSGLFRLEVVF